MTQPNIKPLAYRPKQAAEVLGVCERTLWNLTAPRGPIPCLRVGKGKRQIVLYPIAELTAWMNQEAQEQNGGQA